MFLIFMLVFFVQIVNQLVSRLEERGDFLVIQFPAFCGFEIRIKSVDESFV